MSETKHTVMRLTEEERQALLTIAPTYTEAARLLLEWYIQEGCPRLTRKTRIEATAKEE